MKVLFAIFLLMYCITQGSAYFFPMCTSKDDKSCKDYFIFPTLSFPSLNFGGDEHQNVFHNMDEPIPHTTGAAFENIDKIATFVMTLIAENMYPFVNPMYLTFHKYVSPLKEQYIHLLRYVPFLNYEKKVKADSRLYILFVATSLGIYLALYVYFTRKLYFYYRQTLREQYLNNVKKIFNKGKEQ